jgi:hypothetical protein
VRDNAGMANTLITFAVLYDGKPRHVTIKMTGEELHAAVTGGGTLVRLPTGDDEYVYLNPAYILMAQEQTGDEEPMFARGPR